MAVDIAANALIDLDEIKEWLDLESPDTDDFLQRSINHWSDAVETRLNRTIGSADYEDEQHDGGKRALLLKHIPVTAISEISIDGAALDADDYVADLPSGIIRPVNRTVFSGGRGAILVSYTAGYSETPGDIKRALIRIVALDYYLSKHGRGALATRSVSTQAGAVTFERGPEDQEKLMRQIERRYAKR